MATPLSFFVKGPDGLSLLVGPPFNGEPQVQLSRIPCLSAIFSNDGSMLAVCIETAVNIYDTGSGVEIRSLQVAGVKTAAFSPNGNFLQTFQPPNPSLKNVNLWSLKTGESVYEHSQKNVSKSSWPIIQFSDDETVACRMATNEFQFFDPQDFSKGVVDRLRVPGMQTAELAMSPPTYVAAYVPEIKGAPASVRIYERDKVSQAEAVARRSFYKSSSARLLWNKGSTALLVLAQSDVDKSNQSYYGEARLHYLKSDGSHEGTVPLSKEGPVHDVQWSPTGKEFLVVYGFMPACATLYDERCRVLHHFKSGPYNTVRWNPQGSFLCLAGYGNLPGDMTFWERSKLTCLGSTRSECSVTSEWSSDGRYFMTATTAPRLQVDNGIKIFKYDGSLYFEKKYDKLYQAEWKPAAPGVYEDRPPSPNINNDKKIEKGVKGGAASGKPAGPTLKPAAYQAPHARATAAIRAQLLGEDTAGSSGELSKSALKNKKRREKQKEKRDIPDALKEEISEVGQKLEAMPVPLNGIADSSGQADEAGKKLRALHKKLRQIEEIKQKVADGASLNPAQKEKLAQESALREEINTLEAQQ